MTERDRFRPTLVATGSHHEPSDLLSTAGLVAPVLRPLLAAVLTRPVLAADTRDAAQLAIPGIFLGLELGEADPDEPGGDVRPVGRVLGERLLSPPWLQPLLLLLDGVALLDVAVPDPGELAVALTAAARARALEPGELVLLAVAGPVPAGPGLAELHGPDGSSLLARIEAAAVGAA